MFRQICSRPTFASGLILGAIATYVVIYEANGPLTQTVEEVMIKPYPLVQRRIMVAVVEPPEPVGEPNREDYPLELREARDAAQFLEDKSAGDDKHRFATLRSVNKFCPWVLYGGRNAETEYLDKAVKFRRQYLAFVITSEAAIAALEAVGAAPAPDPESDDFVLALRRERRRVEWSRQEAVSAAFACRPPL